MAIDVIVTECGVLSLSDRVRSYLSKIDQNWQDIYISSSRSNQSNRVKKEIDDVVSAAATVARVAFATGLHLKEF